MSAADINLHPIHLGRNAADRSEESRRVDLPIGRNVAALRSAAPGARAQGELEERALVLPSAFSRAAAWTSRTSAGVFSICRAAVARRTALNRLDGRW